MPVTAIKAALVHLIGADHSPSQCAVRMGCQMSAEVVARLRGEPVPEPMPCECPCRRCQQGHCSPFGAPPMTPAERAKARKRAVKAREKRLAQQRVFSTWELPEGRTANSFRYQVDEVYAHYDHLGEDAYGIEDTYLTDHADERDQLVANILAAHNEARVTERATGRDDQASWYRPPED